jgi:hypothetical protein
LKLKLGEILVRERVLTQAQLAKALAHQKAAGAGRMLGEVVVELGLATEKQLLQALTQSLGLPAVDLRGIEPSPDALEMLPAKQAREQRILPLRIVERSGRKRLIVALADPSGVAAIDELQFSSGMIVEVKVTTAGQLMTAIERHYGTESSPPRKVVTLDAGSARPPTLVPSSGKARSAAPPSPSPAPAAGPARPSRKAPPGPPPPSKPAPPSRPAGEARAGEVAVLTVCKGPHAGLAVSVPAKTSLVFGRGGADVVIEDEKMSRRHFAVADSGRALELEDLGSSNGTLVNGTRVEAASLGDGDRILAGATTFEVRLLARPDAQDGGQDEGDSSTTTQKVDAREFQRQAEAKEKPRRSR